jgi:hypothetical protein
MSVVPLELVDWSSIYIWCSSISGVLEQHLCLLFLYSWYWSSIYVYFSSTAGGLEQHLCLLSLIAGGTGAAYV